MTTEKIKQKCKCNVFLENTVLVAKALCQKK